MLSLAQAIESGKKFTRQSILDSGDLSYFDPEQFLAGIEVEDITASDYILLPDELTTEVLASIWNRNKASSTPTANESKFFSKMISELKSNGFIKE